MVRNIRLRVGNLPVVAVVSPLSPQPASYADRVIYDANPAQWLWLINNAEFVYTDSYHGLLFALRAGRPSLAYRREAIRSPRMVDVADRYELHCHVVSGVEAARRTSGWDEPVSDKSMRRVQSMLRCHAITCVMPSRAKLSSIQSAPLRCAGLTTIIPVALRGHGLPRNTGRLTAQYGNRWIRVVGNSDFFPQVNGRKASSLTNHLYPRCRSWTAQLA